MTKEMADEIARYAKHVADNPTRRPMTEEQADEIIKYVNEHARLYGCRFQAGRWRHFCGIKTPPKEPDERSAAEAGTAAAEKT
jgi:hypothetical protein